MTITNLNIKTKDITLLNLNMYIFVINYDDQLNLLFIFMLVISFIPDSSSQKYSVVREIFSFPSYI